MPVNQSKPPVESFSDPRLYLREDELDRAVALVFAAARRFWKTAQGPLSEAHLGPAHYRALAAIRRAEGLSISDLQAALDVRKQSLARTLDELEKAGLIQREPGRADRRQRLLRLTETGRAAERATAEALRERLAHVFRIAGADNVAGARVVLAALAAEDEK